MFSDCTGRVTLWLSFCFPNLSISLCKKGQNKNPRLAPPQRHHRGSFFFICRKTFRLADSVETTHLPAFRTYYTVFLEQVQPSAALITVLSACKKGRLTIPRFSVLSLPFFSSGFLLMRLSACRGPCTRHQRHAGVFCYEENPHPERFHGGIIGGAIKKSQPWSAVRFRLMRGGLSQLQYNQNEKTFKRFCQRFCSAAGTRFQFGHFLIQFGHFCHG